MKILEKIKKVFLTIGMFFVTLPTRIFALNSNTIALYGVPEPQPEYGVFEPSSVSRILENIGKIISIIIIPLILIVGIIIYLKKSKSSKLRKVITVLLAVAITIFVSFMIYKIIELLAEMY